MIWKNILVGILLIVITILIHSVATKYIIHIIKRKRNPKNTHIGQSNEFWVAVMVLIMFLASLSEASVWAFVYHWLGALPDFRSSLYFSIVTFTTLGYGDITLNESWRLLASFEATLGIIVFGWSTAIVMAVVQKLYFKKS